MRESTELSRKWTAGALGRLARSTFSSQRVVPEVDATDRTWGIAVSRVGREPRFSWQDAVACVGEIDLRAQADCGSLLRSAPPTHAEDEAQMRPAGATCARWQLALPLFGGDNRAGCSRAGMWADHSDKIGQLLMRSENGSAQKRKKSASSKP